MRAVLFDVGNTLIHIAESVGAVYARASADHGRPADPERLDEAFGVEFMRHQPGFLSEIQAGTLDEALQRGWWRKVVAHTFLRAGHAWPDTPAFHAFFDDLYDRFSAPQVWALFPDVLPALETLEAQGLALGIVSNWDSRLRKILDGLDLTRRFETVVISAEYGAEKPHPSIFREALGQLGARPGEALHVGDLWELDVVGARSAGIKALWLDRDGGDPDPARKPARIRSLAEVPSRVLNVK